MKRFFACFALLVGVTGCSMLPSGEAPEGDLVCNRICVTTQAQIAEHLATRLSLFMVEKHPGQSWMLVADPRAAQLAAPAVCECANFGSPRVENSPLRVVGETLPDGWSFTFFEGDHAVWSEKYFLKEK